MSMSFSDSLTLLIVSMLPSGTTTECWKCKLRSDSGFYALEWHNKLLKVELGMQVYTLNLLWHSTLSPGGSRVLVQKLEI